MVKVRVWGLLCLVVLFAGTAYGQFERTAKYTQLPDRYSEEKELRDEGEWFIKAFKDPVAVIAAEPDRFAAELNKQPFEIQDLARTDADTLRNALAEAILPKSKFDPIFEAIYNLAGTPLDDRFAAVRAARLLCDATAMNIKEYPRIADPVRTIMLADIEDPRLDMKFVAIRGLALVGNPPGGRQATDALLKQLASNDEELIEAAAIALGDIGDVSAVRPLMERFLALPDDGTAAEDDGSPAMNIGPPLHQGKLAIAIAVGKLTGVDRQFTSQSTFFTKSDIIAKYADLASWWEANKGKY